MNKKMPGSRFRIVLSVIGACLLIGVVFSFSGVLEQPTIAGPRGESGTMEKMIVANGSATFDLDLNRLNGINSTGQNTTIRFAAEQDAFFTVVVFNNELRGPSPSSMPLVPQDRVALPKALSASIRNLVIESTPWGGEHELVVRDGRTGFTFFNVEGHTYDYEASGRTFSINGGRLLISNEFAAALGRTADAGVVIGKISASATMRPIEVIQIVDGESRAEVMPALGGENGTTPGPDVIVGDLTGLQQFGSSGTQVGLAVGTDSCNAGTENLHWFANPSNDHPVIPQNLYRMSGGAANDQRFEQIGQSSVKHAFTALTGNICGFGCNGVGGSNLGSGCSDPYGASLNAGPSLGSRAWINPFTGFYPRNDGATPNNNHTGHTHTGTSHRILVEAADLNTTTNPGATYVAEAQYITPHEYVWCQANPTQCNMNNNVSYRKYSVSGTTSFNFGASGSTVRMQPAVASWPGATLVQIRPDPINDGVAYIAYKVTNTGPGVWHYEYAIYNQNLDRAISSFSVPVGNGVNISNIGFHAPPQHPGWSADGTINNLGFSSTPWAQSEGGGFVTWASETFAQNANANAVRWGTLYNVRFDSDRAPMLTRATVGFLKTGSPIEVTVQGPSNAVPTCSRLPTGNRCS
jgi:hypothetical protein